jgi:hypothetical protein
MSTISGWGRSIISIIEEKIWLLVISLSHSDSSRQSCIIPEQAWCVALQRGMHQSLLMNLSELSQKENNCWLRKIPTTVKRGGESEGKAHRKFCLWVVHCRGSLPTRESIGVPDPHGHSPGKLLPIRHF